MLEVDDFVAGVGIGFGIELRNETVKKRILPSIGDQDDLVGAIVGGVGGGGAELGFQRGGDRVDFVHEVAGFGVKYRVELRAEVCREGLVDILEQKFDALEIGDA